MLQQPGAALLLGDGIAQGMMQVVAQHVLPAALAYARGTHDIAGHLQRVPVRPQAYFRLISHKDLTGAQPAPTSGQGALEGLLPRLKLCAALHSWYGSARSRTSDPCRTVLLSGERRPNPLPASV